MKKLLVLVLTIVMVFSLTACSSEGEKKADAPKENPTAAPAKEEAAPADTEEATEERPYYVKGEDEITGTITVYTTMEETQQEALKEIWSKYYPNCSIEIQDGVSFRRF